MPSGRRPWAALRSIPSLMGTLILRALLTGLLVVAAEMLHGIFRVKFLNPRVGDRTARRLGVFSGSALLFVLAWLVSPWLDPTASSARALVVGSVWLSMLIALDVGVGRLVFRFRWKRILDDFNPAKGSFLLFGMAFAFFCPLLASLLRSR